MLANLKEDEFFFNTNMHFALLNKEIAVMIDKDNPDFDFAEKCMKALNNLSEEVIDKLCACSIKYSEDFCEMVGEEEPEVKTNRDILKYIQPGALIINADEREDYDIVLHLELNCEWEEEHGLEWLIADNEVLYVGSFNDVMPKYHGKGESWNYVTEEEYFR